MIADVANLAGIRELEIKPASGVYKAWGKYPVFLLTTKR
jgi:hypothetical protein